MTTTQLDGSIGYVPEVTYGTPLTVTKFDEFLGDSTLTWDATFAQGQGLRVGSRVARSARRPAAPVKQMTSIGLHTEITSKGKGWILNAATGSVTSTQRGATSVYQHNFTLAAGDFLPSGTIQNGVPPLGGGNTIAHTYPGCVCQSLQINVPNSDIPTLLATFTGREVQTGVAYAAPSYPTPQELLTFTGATINLGGTPTAPTTTALGSTTTAPTDIIDFQLTIDNGLDDGGFNMGGGGKRVRKPAIGLSPITGQITAEFDSVTLRDYYLNQTDLPLVVTILGASTIGTGSDNPAFSIYLPNIRLEGELPPPQQTGIHTLTIPFTAFDNLSAAPVTISYVTTDTAP